MKKKSMSDYLATFLVVLLSIIIILVLLWIIVFLTSGLISVFKSII